MSAEDRLTSANRAKEIRSLTADLTSSYGSPALTRLVEACRLSHRAAFPVLVRDLTELTCKVDWLAEAIDDKEQYKDSILTLKSFNGPESTGWSGGNAEDDWAVLTLSAAASSDLGGLASLGAVFLLALIDLDHPPASTGKPQCPSQSAIEALGRDIRSLDKKASIHPLRSALSNLVNATSALEVGRQFVTDLRSGATQEKTRDYWERHLIPWLQSADIVRSKPPEHRPTKELVGDEAAVGSTVTGPGTSESIAAENEDKEQARWRKRYQRRPLWIPVRSDDQKLEGEPESETAPPAELLTTGVTRSSSPAPDPFEAKLLCFQAVRQRNSELLLNHIEVLSTPEIEHVLMPSLKAQFSEAQAIQDWSTCARIATRLLVLASGRTREKLAKVKVTALTVAGSAVPIGLELDLVRGELRQPIFRPEGTVEITKEMKPRLEVVGESIDIPLPPTLVEMFRWLNVHRPVEEIGQWLSPDLDLDTNVRWSLTEADHVPTITASLGRARKWAAAKLQDTGRDIASTMLLCGDTFGRSTAPLFYYAPPCSVLRNLYRDAIWSTFGDASPAAEPPCLRVGDALAVKIETVRRGVESMSTTIDSLQRRASASLVGRIALHNELASYVLHHFVFLTGHRPTNALFRLLNENLGLWGMMAIVDDKRVDAAHLWRPVAMTQNLTEQISAFTRHLIAMSTAEHLPLETRKRCAESAASNKPLFFFLDSDGLPIVDTVGFPYASLEKWGELRPKVWDELPQNWIRHFLATHLRECGAEPLLVLAQCGHLEAAGYPFHLSSIISPARFAKELQAPLMRFERLTSHGFPPVDDSKTVPIFEVKRGFGRAGLPVPPCPPMRDWSLITRAHENAARTINRSRTRYLVAQRWKHRREGLAVALELLRPISPTLHKLISQEMSSGRLPKTLPAEFGAAALKEADAIILVDRLDQLNVDPIVALAARDQLRAKLRSVRKRFKLAISDIGSVYLPPPSESSPFFSGMLHSVRQIEALQCLFVEDAKTLREEDPELWRALTLIVLSGVSNKEELRPLLAAEPVGLVDAAGPAAFLKYVDGNTVRGYGAHGLAGLALVAGDLKHREKDPGGAVTPVEEVVPTLSQRLHKRYPDMFSNIAPDMALDCLLQTNEIANRLRLSGLARHMTSDAGSASAQYELQIALLNQDYPTGGAPGINQTSSLLSLDQLITETGTEHDPLTASKLRRTHRQVAARREFLGRVRKALGATEDDSLASQPIKKREEIIDGLGILWAEVEEATERKIEHALLAFIRDLAIFGTDERENLAPSTLLTYLSAVSKPLSGRFEGIDLRGLNSDEFTDVYVTSLQVMEDAQTAARTARLFLRFHKVLSEIEGIEPVEIAALAEWLSPGHRLPTANSTTPAETRAAIRWMERVINNPSSPKSGCMRRRLFRIARIALSTIEAAGVRISELTFLRFSDILIVGDFVLVFIRPSIFRSLKTGAARRIIELTARLSSEDRLVLIEWIRGERIRRGSDLGRNSFIFPDESSTKKAVGSRALRALISESFRAGAGRHCWPHLLRHQSVHNVMLSTAERTASAKDAADLVRAYRQLKTDITGIGHTVATTSSTCYFHVPWLFRSNELRLLSDSLSRDTLSTISGVKISTIDKLKQRSVTGTTSGVTASTAVSKLVDSLVAWQNQQIARASALRLVPLLSLGDDRLGVAVLEKLLRASDTESDFRLLSSVSGLLQSDVDDLLAAIQHISTDFNYCLLSIEKGSRSLQKIPVPRPTRPDLSALAQQIDLLPPAERKLLAKRFSRCRNPRAESRENALIGTVDDVHDLRGQLNELGVTGLDVQSTDESTAAKCMLTVRSPDGEVSGFDYLRWLLILNVAIDSFNSISAPTPQKIVVH